MSHGTERDLVAEMRGLCIHNLRAKLLLRHRGDQFWRRHVRIAVARQVSDLRDLGPGPVVMPDTVSGGTLGPDVTWWGPRNPR